MATAEELFAHENEGKKNPPTQALGISSGGGGKMFPFEGESIDSVVHNDGIQGIPSGSADSLIPKPAPLEGTMNELGSRIVNYLGAEEAKGEVPKFQDVGAGERQGANIGTLTAEVHAKVPGLMGSPEGQSR